MLLQCTPWAWTVIFKLEPQGRFWNSQLVFVVWQLFWYPSPSTWARKLRRPTGSVHLNTALFVPHVYCLDMRAGGQGAENKAAWADYRCGFTGWNKEDFFKHIPRLPNVFSLMFTLTCGNVGAGTRCTVTLASLCSDCGHVGFAAQEICKDACSSSWAARNCVSACCCCIHYITRGICRWCPWQRGRVGVTDQGAILDRGRARGWEGEMRDEGSNVFLKT